MNRSTLFVLTRRAHVTIVAALVIATLAASGCSSPSGSTAGGEAGASAPASAPGASAAAGTNLAKYTAPISVTPIGAGFNAGAAKGKTVWWVTQLGANPFLASLGANLKEALGKAGVNVITCDGQGNPVAYNACIQKAVSQKAAAIQVDGPEPKTFANQIAAAKATGIPIFSGAAQDASEPLFSGLSGQSSQPFKLTGQLAADWIAQDSQGKAHILFITVPDVIGSVQEQGAFTDELASVCPNCQVSVQGVTLANWATQLQPLANAQLRTDPKINYVVPAFDPMAAFIDPAINQAGKAGSVKVVTVNGSLQQMQALKAGQNIVAEVGLDLYALGYIEADQILRVLAGQSPLDKAYSPVRVFTKQTAATLDLTADAAQRGVWFADPAQYSTAFVANWKR